MKLELLTNANVVDDAIRFVSNHNKHGSSENVKQEYISNLQAEEESATTNRVF
jgi:hypothetical protein